MFIGIIVSATNLRLTILVLPSFLEEIRDHILNIFLNFNSVSELKNLPWSCHSVLDIREVLGVFM